MHPVSAIARRRRLINNGTVRWLKNFRSVRLISNHFPTAAGTGQPPKTSHFPTHNETLGPGIVCCPQVSAVKNLRSSVFICGLEPSFKIRAIPVIGASVREIGEIGEIGERRAMTADPFLFKCPHEGKMGTGRNAALAASAPASQRVPHRLVPPASRHRSEHVSATDNERRTTDNHEIEGVPANCANCQLRRLRRIRTRKPGRRSVKSEIENRKSKIVCAILLGPDAKWVTRVFLSPRHPTPVKVRLGPPMFTYVHLCSLMFA